MRDTLVNLWPTIVEPLARSLNARANQRLRSMEVLLRDRCDAEVAAIGTVLDELEASIRTALQDDDLWQPSLFDTEDVLQRQQLNTDHDALRRRLDELPRQREQEIAALKRRYADPTTRWFPVAVTLLVPEAIARQAKLRAATR